MAVLNRLEAKFIFLALGDQLGQIDNLITATKIDDDSDDQYSLNLEKAVKLSCYLTTNDLAKVLIGTNDMNRWADILSKPAFCFHVTCAHEEYQFVGKILVSLREYSAYNRLIDALRDHDRHGRIGHEREVLPLALRAELLLSPNTHAHRPA
jgi:hypothetical protein